MKGILFLIVVLGAALASPLRKNFISKFEQEAEMNFDDIMNMIDGLLTSLNVKHDVNELHTCVLAVPELVKKMKKWIDDFKVLDWKDLEKVFDMFVELFDAFKDLFQSLKPCVKVPAEMEALLKKISNINLDKMLARILLNAMEIFEWITQGIQALQEKNYRDFGINIGNIVYLILIDDSVTTNPYISFMEGFLQGINEKGSIEEVLKCLKDVEPIVKEIIEAIELISHMTFGDIVKGVTMLIAAVKELITKMEPCTKGFEQLQKLLEKIIGANIMQIVVKIISNPIPFISDIMGCIEAFKKADFLLAGKDLGNLMYILFLEDTARLGFNFTNFVDMVKGFMKALDQLHNFENLEKCLEKAPEIFQAVADAIKMLKEVDWRHLDKLIECLLKLFDAFKDILKAITPCSKTPGELEAIIKKVKEMTLEKLRERIMANMIQIVADLIEAIRHLTGAAYFSFGQDIGDLFFMLFLKQ